MKRQASAPFQICGQEENEVTQGIHAVMQAQRSFIRISVPQPAGDGRWFRCRASPALKKRLRARRRARETFPSANAEEAHQEEVVVENRQPYRVA